MAYTKTVWANREVERPRTYTLTENADGTVTLTPAEGEVFVAGTPIDAVLMNKIENQIDVNDAEIQNRVRKTGDTMTGNLVAPIVNAQTRLQENGVPLDQKYVLDNVGQTIQSGITTLSASTNTNKTVDVTFPTEFTGSPKCFAMVANSTSADAFGRIVVGARKNGMSITVYATMSATVTIHWFAIGTI